MQQDSSVQKIIILKHIDVWDYMILFLLYHQKKGYQNTDKLKCIHYTFILNIKNAKEI